MSTKLSDLIKNLNSEHSGNLFSTGEITYNIERIPFSSPRANYMTYGGIPLGRIVEFAGEESGGKTTTALDVVGNAQKYFQAEWEEEINRLNNSKNLSKAQIARLDYLNERGPRNVVWIDSENTFDDLWAEKNGVNVETLIKMTPQQEYAEEIFQMALQLMDTGDVGLIVLDSLGILMSKQQYEKDVEDKTYGGIALALTRFSKEACMICAKQKCTFIGINQLRDDMNSMYGGVTTPGGRGWKHHCSLRIMFRKGELFDDKYKGLPRKSESCYGNIVEMQIVKTKVCKPNRLKGNYTLVYDKGVDALTDIVDLCIAYDIIHKAGAWFTLIDPETGELVLDSNGDTLKLQGATSVKDYLESNTELLDKYIAEMDKICKQQD